jgi:hypothetical protein
MGFRRLTNQVHNVPTAVVDARGGRDVVSSNEDERPVDLFHELVSGLLVDEVRDRGKKESDPEEVQEPGVDGTNRVETCWSNETPDLRIVSAVF